MRKLILVIILVSLFSCNSDKNTDIILKKGKAIIEGKVHNFNNSARRVIRFAEVGVVEEIERTAIIDSLGNFRIVIDLYNPQNVNLFYGKGMSYLYLEPGDSLFLDIDANKFEKEDFPYYQITGLNSSTSENIRDYFQYHNPFSYIPVYKKPVKEFLNDLKRQLDIEDSILNKFFAKENTTDKFKYWVKNEIKYSLANCLIGYFAHYDINYKQYKTEILDTKIFPVNEDSAIVIPMYILHITNYAFAKYMSSDSIYAQLEKKKEISKAYSRVFNNIIKNEKTGLSRDIMVYKIFQSLYEKGFKVPLDSLTIIWGNYKKQINNPVLIKRINEDLLASKKNNEEDNAINTNMGLQSKLSVNFLETLHSKHKDKIIYISIWATWCGPCRSEIPFEIELQDYFRNKQVAFVNLCLSSNKGDWEKVISQNHIKGDNYFFNEDESNIFRSDMKISGYPTYMIMDKRGKMINKTAPRPSSGNKIETILNKLLEKK